MARRLSFSNRLRALRQQHGGMTQAELGAVVGVTRQTIIAIEQGRYSPSLESAFRLAQAFGVPLEEVFIWEGEGGAVAPS